MNKKVRIHPAVFDLQSDLRRGKMSRRDFLRLATLLGVSVATAKMLAGCSPSPQQLDTLPVASLKRGGTMKIGTAVQPIDHPARLAWIEGANQLRQVAEYLTETDPDNLTRPWLLERWEADEEVKTWILYLRRGIKFNNGEPLTADDVIFNFEQWLDPQVGSSMASLLSYLNKNGIEIVDISPASLSLFGYSRAELLTMKAHDLYVNPADRLKFEQEIERQGAVRDFEINYLRKDGQVRDCLVTATVRRTAEGAILSYQGIIRDITEQKRVEKERLRLSAIERELTLAQEIQHSLLPPAHPDWNGPDVVCYSIPAREMGGDLYAYHAFASAESSEPAATIKGGSLPPATDSRYAIAVGDVSGKGMPAALLMAVSLASFQAVVRQGLPPRALLAHLDQAIAPYNRTTGQNCALVYLEITPPSPALASSQLGENKGGRLRVANAGCVTPLIRPVQGPVAWVDIYGTPLGIGLSSESGYLEAEIPLSPGDMIILTSDGVVEANNAAGVMFGFDRLEQAVISGPATSAKAMLDHLKAEVAAFVGQTEPHDDLTIVVVQV